MSSAVTLMVMPLATHEGHGQSNSVQSRGSADPTKRCEGVELLFGDLHHGLLLPTSEEDGDLDSMTFLEKFLHLLALVAEIVLGRLGAKPNLLGFQLLLLLKS
jgi:hypothetical protein